MAAIDRMAAAERGEDDPLTSDIAFHLGVIHASGNRFYSQLSDLIVTALHFSIRTTNNFKGVKLASIADHKKIADAIMAGNVQAAEIAMRSLDLIQSAQAAAANSPRSRRQTAEI
jgi:DNA-binding FadR family transcriptional regulator